ncbi:DUF3500 domain-containing protein [Mangrovihabitans endophyticus]|uniref:Uncharacterized protein n=1 Tax=Mangrovihabitans endophyticus TaxID=1751298 RepID=A0A8J3FNA1_9ACTN|nr:DUF3500 domain-containing protein [Mangrovihabitans endophyticus]GGK79791.1 hypothetical protein GCM10012284_12250 [Mangrovihabitans endophyticus]
MSDTVRDASPSNGPAGINDPALLERRAFMKRLMIGSGAAAFAAMGAATLSTGMAWAADPSPSASASTPPSGGPPPGGGPANQSVTDDFFGLTADGYRIDDLFAVHSTGVSTAEVVAAATAFLAALDDTQKAAAQFDLRSIEWRQWSNVDSYVRNGVQLGEMTAAQKQAGLALVRSALSARGITLTDTIRRINGVAGRLIGSTVTFNEDYYFFTVMGNPSATEPWGFQFEGHHLVLNYFVLGDQVVTTPSFLGSEPTTVTDDQTGAELSVFGDFFDLAVTTINALTPAHAATAILTSDKTGDDNVAEAFKDNVEVSYAGVRADGFSTAEKRALLALIAHFLSVHDTGHAAVKLAEVTRHIDDTYFAWKGATTDDAVFWLRVQSPVIYIEFDCETPGPLGSIYGAGGPGGGSKGTPSRQHVHCVIRTPNGNDYGKELLHMHYATAPHHRH